MAPLPSNNTNVLYLDYITCLEPHTTQIRFGSGAGIGGAMTVLNDLLAAIDNSIRNLDVIGARVRDQFTNVTYPVTWTGLSSYGSGAGTHNESAYYWDFVGRSIDGRRCRVAVFGAVLPADATNNDFRITAGESTRVQDCLDVLEAGIDCPVSISGQAVNWQQYVNIGTNAYWRNNIR